MTNLILIDINGDALHASLGLPPALNVTTAKVGKLEIIVRSLFFNLYLITCHLNLFGRIAVGDIFC